MRQRGGNRPCPMVQPGMVDLTIDPEIEEIAPSLNRVCGDDIRLQREVSDSFLLSPENVDVTNIDNVLRIPFDYEALMQESSENESNIVSSQEHDTDSNQGDFPNITAISHNTSMGTLLMQDHTSQSESSPRNTATEHDAGNEAMMYTPVTVKEQQNVTNMCTDDMDINTPCYNNNVAADYTTDDTLPYQEEVENTDKSEKDIVISHNELDETNNQDESIHNDDVDSSEQNSEHTIVTDNTDNNVAENRINDLSHNTHTEIQPNTTITKDCPDDDNSNIVLDPNDNTNIEIVQELLQTVLSTVENKLLEECELPGNEIKTSDKSVTDTKIQINIISVVPGDDGVQIKKTEKVSVEQTYDKEALIKDINCCVKLRRLKKQDIALWKPMPKPLNAEINTVQPSKANNIRRNPKRKAKDSIDYMLCQNDNSDSEEDNTEEFKFWSHQNL